MTQRHQIVSTVLLVAGVGLVFAGMGTALQFSTAGIVATIATIAGLLYAGGVWFGAGAPGDPSVVIFDRRLIVVSGAQPGRPIGDIFPPHARDEVEQRCRDAFDGRSTHFSVPAGLSRRRFEVAPIRTADGLVAYGILLSDALASPASHEHLTPVG